MKNGLFKHFISMAVVRCDAYTTILAAAQFNFYKIQALAIYSIKDLEQLSGIKAHTIRMWEQRYDLLKPQRTDTNIRYYVDEDLRFLLNVALLKKNGLRISKIAAMPKEEVSSQVKKMAEAELGHENQVDALTIAMIEMDEYKFDRIVSANTQMKGFEHTMLFIIHPFLNKMRLLWLTGSVNPVQENFISHLVRRKIMIAIDQCPMPSPKQAKKFAIYLPQGETQELSLLFLHYLLRSRGHLVLYLGTGISPDDLRTVCDIQQPDYVFGMMMQESLADPLSEYATKLAQVLPETQLLFSGQPTSAPLPNNASLLPSLVDVLHFLKNL
jgi:DNA-binding transcriptional MerR regulator